MHFQHMPFVNKIVIYVDIQLNLGAWNYVAFLSRLQKLNAYLEGFPPDTEGQETAPLPANEIMVII